MVHLAANGCLVMSAAIPRINELFSADEIVYFDTPDDCEEKIRYYLAHKEEADEIAKAGQKRAHQAYDSEVISSDMLSKVFN